MRIFILCLALCILSTLENVVADDKQAELVLEEMRSVEQATGHLAESIKSFLGGSKTEDLKLKDRLKEGGGKLGKVEADLSEQMGLLGEFLGLPKPPMPPPGPAPQ